jgi:hypothetical protein
LLEINDPHDVLKLLLQDARVPGSKAFLNNPRLRKLLKRPANQRLGGSAVGQSGVGIPADHNARPVAESKSLVEAVSEQASRRTSMQGGTGTPMGRRGSVEIVVETPR